MTSVLERIRRALARVGGRAWIRLAIFALLMLVAALALRFTPLRELIDPERLLAELDQVRNHPAAPAIFVACFVTLTVLGSPSTPLVLTGGVAFGVGQGFLLNYASTIIGGVVTYALARGLAHDVVVALVGERYRQIERLIQRRGFWSLVRIRFLPIPFFLANVGLALAGVRPAQFVATIALPMAPVQAIWTYFAASLVIAEGAHRGAAIRNMVLATLLLLGLSFLPSRWAAWRRARRLRDLRARRATSRSGRLRPGRHRP